jgi:hypothetical protein
MSMPATAEILAAPKHRQWRKISEAMQKFPEIYRNEDELQ